MPLGSRALRLLSDGGGTILVPIDEISVLTPFAPEVLEQVSEAAEVSLTAVMASGETARIPELAGSAQERLVQLLAEGCALGLSRLAELPPRDAFQSFRRLCRHLAQ